MRDFVFPNRIMLEKTFKVIELTTEPNDIKLLSVHVASDFNGRVSTTLILIELIS